MKKVLSETILGFIQAVLNNQPVILRDSRWWIQSPFRLFFSKLFWGEEASYLQLAKAMEQEIDQVSEAPIIFSEDSSNMTGIEVYDEYLLACDMIDKKLIRFRTDAAKQARHQLLFKTLSWKYRIEEANGGIDASPVQQPLVNVLRKMVYDWKKEQELIAEKSLSSRDILQLQETSQFPEFVLLLLKSQTIQEAYLQWVFRDGNSARIFIEYPQLREKLVECNLNGRIGRIHEEDLKIQRVPWESTEQKSWKKVVTLPFEGVDQDILDEEKMITFRGNYQLSVKEIFEVFKNKTYEVGELEYLGMGITNWNCHKWGFFDKELNGHRLIDFNHNQWWKQLPLVEIISEQEASSRYEKSLDGVSWCVSATATRGTATLDFENTHAFLEIAIPWGDGRYAIYDFGKFACKYPASFFEGISMFCQNLHATVSYPDENIFYSHREQSYYAFLLSPEQGDELMGRLKKDMFKAQQNNFVYQIESDNCALWVHNHLVGVLGAKEVPNMFRMHLLDTEPFGPVSVLFSLIRKLPKFIQTPVLTFFHRPLGAAKKTWIFEKGKYICKSLTRHEFWVSGEVFLPALLHKFKEEGILAHFREFIDQKLLSIGARITLATKILKGKIKEETSLVEDTIVKNLNRVTRLSSET